MSVPLKPDDPCYWMLEQGRADPTKRSKRHVPVRAGCYICEDDEFEMMGLPPCRACPKCSEGSQEPKGHIAADDSRCDDCGFVEEYP